MTREREAEPDGMKVLEEAVEELMQNYTDAGFQHFVEEVYKKQIQTYGQPEAFQFVIRHCVNVDPILSVTCFQFFEKFIQECVDLDQNDLVFALEAAFNASRIDLIVHLFQKKRRDAKFLERHNLCMSFAKMAFKIKQPVETTQKMLDNLSKCTRDYWSPSLFENCLKQTLENKIFQDDVASFLDSWNENILRCDSVLYSESNFIDVNVSMLRKFVSWCLDHHFLSLAVNTSFFANDMAWFSEMLAEIKDDLVTEVFDVVFRQLTPTCHFQRQAGQIVVNLVTGFTEEKLQRCLLKVNDSIWNWHLVSELCGVFCSMGFTRLCVHLWCKVGRMDKAFRLPSIWENTTMVDYTLRMVISSGTFEHQPLFQDSHAIIKRLLEKCSGDPSLLAGLLKCAKTKADVDVVKTLLLKFDPPRCRNTGEGRCQGENVLRGDAVEEITHLCIKAGLSTLHSGCQKGAGDTDQRNELLVALKKNNLAVAKLLLDSGAVSNYHLYEARIQMEGNTQCMKLLKAVELPRSLAKLCCWNISRLIGCGPRRQQKIEFLKNFLPGVLQSKVTLQDIYEEQRLNLKRKRRTQGKTKQRKQNTKHR